MPHRLQELGPQHHAAIRMRLEGASTEEICEALEVQPRTVYLWFGNPLVKAEQARQLRNVTELFVEKLASAGIAAMDQLMEMASQPTQGPMTPELKLKVLREMLDRMPPPCQQSLFAHLSDEELLELARTLGEEVQDSEAPRQGAGPAGV